MKEAIISVDSLSFGYDSNLVLDNVSFDIERGDYIGIIGANGSAKSTLLKLILGLLKPNKGSVEIFGHNIEGFKDWNRVGYLPQNVKDFNTRFPATVEEIVGCSQYSQMGVLKILNRSIKNSTLSALKAVNMEDFKDSLIGNLSGGQQQRVFLARLLANSSEIIIMDEPLIGIDAESQDIFFQIIDRLNKTLGITIVIVLHDMDILKDKANKIFHLGNRKIKIDNIKI
ncbi:zinc transport system ATP-binding protein [Proteiniborus ethanoligenes]|uniref:Zinc transport system ATP-binding protein n=1 Tax=Proteiniborus ethanoligenes TaxID=415015 RepID=A0A1H3PZP0_9FIRM|nr:metal ABC transporter ATP-binding protein [Proteiniborus ethanoligenes]TAH62963.1 MAG: metal ABC transporter ATP-binding protein [Gottschalkiaceae bacterium]SDZ06764.1 zinc transport system ATP-binding protein [Proteiniborus ethanoligenes]